MFKNICLVLLLLLLIPVVQCEIIEEKLNISTVFTGDSELSFLCINDKYYPVSQMERTTIEFNIYHVTDDNKVIKIPVVVYTLFNGQSVLQAIVVNNDIYDVESDVETTLEVILRERITDDNSEYNSNLAFNDEDRIRGIVSSAMNDSFVVWENDIDENMEGHASNIFAYMSDTFMKQEDEFDALRLQLADRENQIVALNSQLSSTSETINENKRLTRDVTDLRVEKFILMGISAFLFVVVVLMVLSQNGMLTSYIKSKNLRMGTGK